MGKSTPTPPPAPDPNVMASAQTGSNIDTAVASGILNRMDSYGPGGSVTYNQTGSQNVGGRQVPTYAQTTTLSPEQQALYNAQTATQNTAYNTANTAIGNAAANLETPFEMPTNAPNLVTNVNGGPVQTSFDPGGQVQSSVDFSNLPALPGANDFAAERDSVTNALMSRFNEDWGREQENSMSRLNALGTQQGTEMWGNEMGRLDRARNDALTQAILAGGQEQSRLFGLASQARGQLSNEALASGQFANTAAGQQFGQNQGLAAFQNTAQGQNFAQGQQNASLNNQGRQQTISEALMERNQPINEVSALLGLGGGVQMPQQAPNFGIGVNPTDYLGAYGLNAQVGMNNYNQQVAANNAKWGAIGDALGAAGSTAIMMSDARVKDIHSRVGQTSSGIPLYLFTYKGETRPQIGVIAQEAAEFIPEAVMDIGGILHVDYSKVA